MRLRYLLVGVVVAALAVGALLRMRRDPMRELFVEALPAWQIARARPDGAAHGEPARRMEKLAARRLPVLMPLLARVDADWPDDTRVRADAAEINALLRARAIPYFLDVQPIRNQPILLSYQRDAAVPWHLEGAPGPAPHAEVDVIRIRRLDNINVEMGLYGETEGSQPLVYLDRVEAHLVTALPAAWSTTSASDEAERAMLGQLRRVLEGAIGAQAMGEAVGKLAERERLFEVMRTRLHGDATQVDHPERFVFGEAWAEELAPYARFSQPGGPLILDTDLRAVANIDEELADPKRAAPLEAAVSLFASVVEAHEARHALDAPSAAPPPGELLDLLAGGDPRFATMADRELRAYLGELHDAVAPACLSLADTVRGVYGRHLRRTPHLFARRVILARLQASLGDGADAPELSPSTLLDRLCALPDAELRRRVADTWEKLYGAPMVAAVHRATR